jgi:hypothetical protein
MTMVFESAETPYKIWAEPARYVCVSAFMSLCRGEGVRVCVCVCVYLCVCSNVCVSVCKHMSLMCLFCSIYRPSFSSNISIFIYFLR